VRITVWKFPRNSVQCCFRRGNRVKYKTHTKDSEGFSYIPFSKKITFLNSRQYELKVGE
jgi:hypothetical protein